MFAVRLVTIFAATLVLVCAHAPSLAVEGSKQQPMASRPRVPPSPALNLGADTEKREAVKRAFLYNYRNYEQFAFGNDTLAPLSKKGQNPTGILGAYGATVYDSLSTMVVMGLKDDPLFHRALAFTEKIDFTKTKGGDPKGVVSIFELTIRAIGGLVSAHDLLAARGSQPPAFLVKQAQSLADTLLAGFVHDIPFNYVNITSGKPQNYSDTANYAEAGTLLLEWSRLSELTNKPIYRNKVLASERKLMAATEVLKGLPGQQIWPQNGTHVDSIAGRYVTWGGGTDSYFEYLPKFTLLEGNDADPVYLEKFVDAVESSVKHLLITTGVSASTFLSDYAKERGGNIYRYSHLGCFAGGSWAFAGRLLQRSDFVQSGLELAESCARTYLGTATGLGPDSFGYYDDKGRLSGFKTTISAGKQEYFKKHGHFLLDADYFHGPEVLESVFYAWRITGQQMWRDIAWSFFQSMTKYLDTKTGWAQLDDVNDISSDQLDDQGTFLYAEVFKYFYMIFDDPKSLSLDEWVLNTENHPIKITRNRSKWPFVQYDRAKPYPYVPLGNGTGFGTDNKGKPSPTLQEPSRTVAPPISVGKQGKHGAAEALQQIFELPMEVARAQYSSYPGQ